MTLVDTSVWVHHLRTSSARLAALLRDEQVLSHPFVVGALACGNLQNRDEILTLLAALPEARVAEHHEVLHLVEGARLYGRGLGWIDAHLLASALISRSGLWTLDKPLQCAAATLRIPV
ncbi:MAG: type II toxin-antitoxin system VapC family toxin [Candidatus Methylomirabilales bacterium]